MQYGEKCYAITLGFHENIALRRIFNYSNYKKGDKIIVFSGSKVAAVVEAYESLRLYLSKLGINDVRLEEVKPDDPRKAILKIVESLSPCRDRLIITELGGGLRSVGMLLLFSLLAFGYKFELNCQIEGSEKTVSIPWEIVDTLKNIMRREKDRLILTTLFDAGEPLSIKELAVETGVSEKTIANRISNLRKNGLIEKKGRGKPSLTMWGETIASIIKLLQTQ